MSIFDNPLVKLQKQCKKAAQDENLSKELRIFL